MDEEAVAPTVEALRITQRGQLAPDLDESLLHGILGQVAIAQEAIRDLLEARVHGSRDERERDLVTSLGPDDQLWVQCLPELFAPASCRRS